MDVADVQDVSLVIDGEVTVLGGVGRTGVPSGRIANATAGVFENALVYGFVVAPVKTNARIWRKRKQDQERSRPRAETQFNSRKT